MDIDPNNLSDTARLTFSEEFNSLSLWNGTSGTWATNYNFNNTNIATLSGNGELQWYVEANDPNLASVDPWTVSGGILTIAAAPADPSIRPYINNYEYTSGLLTTQNSFSQLYGYFEISAKLPDGQGLWPAFWMLPTTGDWRPEIDVLEYLGNDTDSLWQFSHPADATYDRYFNTQTGVDLSADFHRYGVDWEPDKITFYLDGQVTGVAPTAPEYTSPMYLLVNLAVGGSWGGAPDATTTFPADLQIDYIRAYQSLGGATVTNLGITPSAQTGAEGTGSGNSLTYTVTRTGDLSGSSSVTWAVAGSGANPANGADFVGGALPGGVLNFAPGQNAQTVTISFVGDTAIESDESFTLTLSSPTGATITGGSATGAIFNDDAPAATTLAISPATITLAEGNSGTTWFVYTVTRSGSLAGPSSADFVVAGSGANPATASDFVGGVFNAGTLYFGGGESTKNIWVQVAGDTAVEANESFTVSLISANGASITNAAAQGVITNDDGQTLPTLSIGPSSVSKAEGASGTNAYSYTVTRSGDLSGTSSASWSVAGSGANAANGADFVGGSLPSGVVNFAAGSSTATIVVNVAGDGVYEQNEGFAVSLGSPSGATIATGTAQGVITNDDSAPPPTLSIGPSSISKAEGASGTNAYSYTVTRSGDLTGTSSANWSVVGSGANAANGADFVGGSLPSGVVNFAAGSSTATIVVNVAGDGVVEPDEGFTVSLASPSGATIATGTAQGVITNDDSAPLPTLSIGPSSVSKAEGASGTNAYSYTVTRSGDLSGTSSASWSVAGSGANAANGADFVGGALPTGVINFAAGASTATIVVNVAGDGVVEPNEGFTVSLAGPTGATIATGTAQGVITNDDSAPPPSLSIGPASLSKAEGASGTNAYTYTVTRSGDLTGASSASWSVAGAGANAANGADFVGGALPTGVVNFAAGASTATIVVNVAGDGTVESDEGFTVSLAGPTGATIATGTAQGVITNDDSAAPPPAGGTGTAGNDLFILAPGSTLVITGYDAAGQDALGITTGAGGFSLAGYTGQSSFVIADAADWWNSIAGAQVVRWNGAASAVDTAAKVDGLLQAMPGNGGGGVLFLADGPGNVVSVYYDSNPGAAGGTSLVATLNGVASPAGLNASDFVPASATPPGPTISIQAATVALAEGASGSTAFQFTVTRSGDLSAAASANWAVTGGKPGTPAGSLEDYSAEASDFIGGAYPSGTVNFAAGQSSATISVQVAGDATPESDQGFGVTLSGFSGAAAGANVTAYGDILNDDGGRIAFGAAATSLSEGNSGSTAFAYTLTRSGSGAGSATVAWSVGGSGVAGGDFIGGVLPSGTATFASGQTSTTITVLVAGDSVVEPNESFTVTLGAVTNGFLDLGAQSRTSTILNDDGSSGGGGTGTAGNDTFNLWPNANLSITGYDQAGQDRLGIPTGAGGFQLAGYVDQPQLTIADAVAWWSNISNAQVVRWVGPLSDVDTAAEVDALLEAMPGNSGGGRLFVGGAAGGVGLYYDANPQARGDTTLIATLVGVTDTHALTVNDFWPI